MGIAGRFVPITKRPPCSCSQSEPCHVAHGTCCFSLFCIPLPLPFAVAFWKLMDAFSNHLSCDGCGLPASPEHIAERVRRLELATKYRPVHISVLFVAVAPPRLEDDFYAPPGSKEFFDPFLEALEIPRITDSAAPESDASSKDTARLLEFQRRGYYLAYLAECPLPQDDEPVAAAISRLGPNLIRRIRFNYKPKSVAPLGSELAPVIELLRGAGIGQILTLDQGAPLFVPRTGDGERLKLFQRSVAIGATPG